MGLQLKMFYVIITSDRIAISPSLISIVARGGVVYEFYMERSCIDFVYIFSLKYKYSLRAQALISVHATANTILPGLLVIHLHHTEYQVKCRGGGGGVMETTGKVRHIEVTEKIFFCFSRVT